MILLSNEFENSVKKELERLIAEQELFTVDSDKYFELLQGEFNNSKSHFTKINNDLKICLYADNTDNIETFIDIKKVVKKEIQFYEEEQSDENLDYLINYFTKIVELLKKHNK